MKQMKNILMIALLAFAAASCAKEGSDTPSADAELIIIPQVAGEVTGEIKSRAPINDTTFSLNSQIGLKVTSNAVTLHQMYDHFYTAYDGTDWRYYLSGNNSVTTLAGFTSWGTIEVMGYYPYNAEGVTDFAQIPFRIAESDGTATQDQATKDYMVAGSKTKDMVANTPALITLEFEHLMTYLYLTLQRAKAGLTLTLSKAVLEIDSGREFIISGTYNATNPASSSIDPSTLITPDETTDKLEISINQALPITATTTVNIPLVIMPQLLATNVEGTKIKLTLYFTDADGQPFLFDDHGNPEMSFKLSDVGSGAGLERGKTYEIKATLGTYVHFDGEPLVVDEPMTEGESEFIEI